MNTILKSIQRFHQVTESEFPKTVLEDIERTLRDIEPNLLKIKALDEEALKPTIDLDPIEYPSLGKLQSCLKKFNEDTIEAEFIDPLFSETLRLGVSPKRANEMIAETLVHNPLLFLVQCLGKPTIRQLAQFILDRDESLDKPLSVTNRLILRKQKELESIRGLVECPRCQKQRMEVIASGMKGDIKLKPATTWKCRNCDWVVDR